MAQNSEFLQEKLKYKECNIRYVNEPMQKVWDYALYLILSHYCQYYTCITPKQEVYLSKFYYHLSKNKQYQLTKNCLSLTSAQLFDQIPSVFWVDNITIKLLSKNNIFQTSDPFPSSDYMLSIYNMTHITLDSDDYELTVSSSLFPLIMQNGPLEISTYLRPKHPPHNCRVLYDYSQMLCCGRTFQVGDKVHWLVHACMHKYTELPSPYECDYEYDVHTISYENLEVIDGVITKIYAQYYNYPYQHFITREIKNSNHIIKNLKLDMRHYIVELGNVTVKPSTYLDFWKKTFDGN